MTTKKVSLALRFYLSVFLFFVVGAIAWGFLAVSSSVQEQREGTQSFLAESGQRVDDILELTADGQADLMDRAVRQLSINLGREFEDIPFEVFEGRDDLLLAYLKERLDDGRRRNDENSRVIADLFRKDAQDLARQKLASLELKQTEDGENLARALRRDLLLWGGAFLIGIGLLIGFVFHRGVAVPLRDATYVIESMRDGDLTQRIPAAESDEINRLAVSFNAMAEEIDSQHRNLEQAVADKTQELRLSLAEQKLTNEALHKTVVELESTQKQLVESEKMAALGTMSRGMAHEFNNILGGVAGLAEDLAQDVDDVESKKVLRVIEKTSRRALVITENLLRFSRGTANAQGVFDLRSVLEESMALVEPEAAHRQIQVDLAGASGQSIVTDGRGLQQVFLNLLINALHASEDNSSIEAKFEDLENEQLVTISDQGAGILPEHLNRIFEPFFSTKDQEEGPGGTGLGLSVARGIVERIGGSLTASSPGGNCGSVFQVRIPKEGVA
ncbi:MAG: two-component system NtrC family sensor kinase [Planctomycetota bacterium]|jgi:two-component system NtrC family sensor kinase